MDAAYTQKKYDRLFRLVELTRHHQRRYFTFKTSVDLDKAKYYERQLDRLVKEERETKDSPQKELF